MRVLLIEGDHLLVRAIRRRLEGEGIAVETALDLDDSDAPCRPESHDVVVLGATLPGTSGLAPLIRWRSAGITTPVLILTTGADGGLPPDAGRTDHLARPFKMADLLSRLRALVDGQNGNDGVVWCHDLEINTALQLVRRAGRRVRLTAREYALLEFLAAHRGKIVTRRMIRESLYSGRAETTSNVIDVYIRYLREKIDTGHELPLILTHRGEGYMLRSDDPSPGESRSASST